MRKVSYGLIGFGGIAQSRIAREGFALDRERFEPLAQAQLIGATDRNPARQAEVEAMGLRWYESTEQMLEDGAIEAVFIATSNASHAALGRTALQARRHCLIEKPIATNLEDAQALCTLAQKQGLCLMADHMMTRNAFNQEARRFVASGRIGEVNDLHLHMTFLFGATAEEAATWRCADPAELGGPIGDVASHCLYMAEFLLQSPVTQLGCVYTPRRLAIAVEDGAFIRFTLASGVSGSITVSFADPRGSLAGTLRNLGYEIYGSAGVLRGYATLFQLSGHAGEPVRVELEYDDGSRREQVQPAACLNIYQQTICDHARAIERGEGEHHAREALHNLRLILAAHASAKDSGRLIEI